MTWTQMPGLPTEKKPPETSANSQTQKDENNLWLYFQEIPQVHAL